MPPREARYTEKVWNPLKIVSQRTDEVGTNAS
jgi:hypothetical protein